MFHFIEKLSILDKKLGSLFSSGYFFAVVPIPFTPEAAIKMASAEKVWVRD